MKPSLLLLVSLLMTGCAVQRDKQLWSIGVVVYGLYLAGLVLTFLVPALHQTKLFRRLVEMIKSPAVLLGNVTIIVGLFVMIGGVAVHDRALSYHLVTLVGTSVFVLGQCLRMWAISQSREQQSVYAKAIAISVGCILGLTYLIIDGDMLNS